MGRRRKIWNITGVVVPPGSLKPNFNNPYYHQTPEQRWKVIVSVCADILLRVARERAGKELPRQDKATATL